VHLPYVENVLAMPTGCFVARSKFELPEAAEGIYETRRPRCVSQHRRRNDPPRRFRRGRFAARSSKRSLLGRSLKAST